MSAENSLQDSFSRKFESFKSGFMKNPPAIVSLGVAIGALVRGVSTMHRHNESQQNRMMQLRVGAQFVCIVSVVMGCAMGRHGPVIPPSITLFDSCCKNS